MRVAILGCTAVGKTTAAKYLAKALAYDHVELDRVAFEPGWSRSPAAVVEARLGHLPAEDNWIVEGNLVGLQLAEMCPSSDLVLWLDYRRGVALRRVIVRSVRSLVRFRPVERAGYDRIRHVFSEAAIVRRVFRTHNSGRREYQDLLMMAPWSGIPQRRFESPAHFERWLETGGLRSFPRSPRRSDTEP
jgi:adenylate kinase family enzyme